MQAAYEIGPDGKLGLSVPGRCPLGEDGSSCVVRPHDRRPRKCGPEHPLVVCRCRAHGVSFTVYPPGHVPYGRIAIVAEDSEGRVVQRDSVGSTLFAAAVEASASPDSRSLQRRTIQRRLGWCAALLGLAGSAEPVLDRIADVLWLPRLVARESARAFVPLQRLRDRGSLVLKMLACVPPARRRTGLFVAGEIAGLWGRPSRWDPGGRTLRPLV